MASLCLPSVLWLESVFYSRPGLFVLRSSPTAISYWGLCEGNAFEYGEIGISVASQFAIAGFHYRHILSSHSLSDWMRITLDNRKLTRLKQVLLAPFY